LNASRGAKEDERLKIGLIGLPLTGKTTVFNLLTGRSEETTGGGRAGSHLANIKVPDPRVDRLSEIFGPKKTTFAEIEFLDQAGFPLGRGGIPSDRLSEMRNLDALVMVLRAFESDTVPRDPDSRGPLADAEALSQELILTDLMLVEKRQEKLRSDVGKGRKELQPELALMEKLAVRLEEGLVLRGFPLDTPEVDLLRGYQLLTRLPLILLANTGGDVEPDDSAAVERLAGEQGLAYLDLDAQAEWEIMQLPGEDREAFLADLGVAEPARDRFIRICYELLDLASFFTVGEDEVKAWTIRRNLGAQRAAGKIHSDLERGFIRAEVIGCDRFFELGSLADARKAGALKLEGKEYPVQDGDILNIRFSV
jgi:GTP-binding protein YchF